MRLSAQTRDPDATRRNPGGDEEEAGGDYRQVCGGMTQPREWERAQAPGLTYVQATVSGKTSALTWEIHGLTLNPFRRTLEPMRLTLALVKTKRGSSL